MKRFHGIYIVQKRTSMCNSSESEGVCNLYCVTNIIGIIISCSRWGLCKKF